MFIPIILQQSSLPIILFTMKRKGMWRLAITSSGGKIEKEDVLLIQVSTEDQLADFLTKAVNKTKLHHVLSKLFIVNIYL